MNDLAFEIITILCSRNETIATAESVTGGALAASLTSVAGASHAFKGGLIAYSAASKIRDLQVDPALIDAHSVYSAEVAGAMALGVERRFESDWAIATTGVAGPGPSHGVAQGKVWVALLGPNTHQLLTIEIAGDREAVRNGAVSSALATFARILER